MKIPWKLISAFYFPLHLAFGSFYVSSFVLNGKDDCRSYCVITMNCADADTLFLFDFFVYTGVGLVLLAFVLPLIISYREKKIIETSIFK